MKKIHQKKKKHNFHAFADKKTILTKNRHKLRMLPNAPQKLIKNNLLKHYSYLLPIS